MSELTRKQMEEGKLYLIEFDDGYPVLCFRIKNYIVELGGDGHNAKNRVYRENPIWEFTKTHLTARDLSSIINTVIDDIKVE